MDKKNSCAHILISVFTGMFFFVMLGILVYSVIKHNNSAIFMSLMGMVMSAFLTSFFITRAVKTKNDVNKNNKEDGGQIE